MIKDKMQMWWCNQVASVQESRLNRKDQAYLEEAKEQPIWIWAWEDLESLHKHNRIEQDLKIEQHLVLESTQMQLV